MIIPDKIIDTWDKRFNRVEQSQSNDRTDLDKIVVNQARDHELMEKALARIIRLESKVFDTVTDALEETNDKMDTLLERKVLRVTDTQAKDLVEKNNFWSRLKVWKRRR